MKVFFSLTCVRSRRQFSLSGKWQTLTGSSTHTREVMLVPAPGPALQVSQGSGVHSCQGCHSAFTSSRFGAEMDRVSDANVQPETWTAAGERLFLWPAPALQSILCTHWWLLSGRRRRKTRPPLLDLELPRCPAAQDHVQVQQFTSAAAAMSSCFEMTHRQLRRQPTHTRTTPAERTQFCSAQVFPLSTEAARGHTSCGSHRGEVAQSRGEDSLISKASVAAVAVPRLSNQHSGRR